MVCYMQRLVTGNPFGRGLSESINALVLGWI
jgi:hypothetical protein